MANLVFVYSAMNSGKSAALLTSAYNYKERGMGTLLIKPGIDTRDSESEIVSRIGLKQEANIIKPDMNIFEFYKWAATQRDIHCVFADEAQFFTKEQIFQLAEISDHYEVPVMAYGLRTDFRGELFEGSKALLALADKFIELKAVCHCGRKATMTARINSSGEAVTTGEVVQLGSEDTYTSLCRKHWVELTGINK